MKKHLNAYWLGGFLFSILLSFLVLTAHASSNFQYKTNSNGDIIITGYSNKNASSITIPSQIDGHNVVEIDTFAFSGFKNLKYVSLPETLEVIGVQAFRDCSKLKSITIPDNVTKISSFAFNGTSLEEGVFISPQSKLKIIEQSAFSYSKLKNFAIPASVTSIGPGAFSNCGVSLAISPQNETFAIIDGVLFRKADKTLICYPRSRGSTSYTVPNGILKIGKEAFSGCGVREITLPSTVIEIESMAFYSSNIEKINFSDNLVSIGYAAFSSCEYLKTFTFPKSVEITGNGLFSDCEKLSEIIIPEDSKLQNINNWGLYDCDNLFSLHIPDGIQISEGAFSDFLDACNHLTLTFNTTNTQYKYIDGVLFDTNSSTLLWYPPSKVEKTYSIPEGTKRIAEAAFSQNSNLQEVLVPMTVESIGDYAFYNCRVLRKINIPSSTKEFGSSLFGGKTKSVMVSVENNAIAVDYLVKNKITFTEFSNTNTDWLND